MLNTRNTDSDESTDELFGDDEIDYSEDNNLLKSSGGDAQTIRLDDRNPHGDVALSNRFVESLEDAVDEEIEVVSLEEILALQALDPTDEFLDDNEGF